MQGLARALESLHIRMEPDILAGARTPKLEDKIALFATDPEDRSADAGPAYPAAAVTLDLACLAALADSTASGLELLHISRQVDIAAYCRGFEAGNEQLKADAIRWLRGEFTTRTDARAALGVRTIIDDASYYDQLKLLTRFVRLSGYSGLLVCLDELVNLYKLANTQARNANYEQILRILNDTLQGSAEGLGFVLGGTPEFLLDTRRGLYSYAALQSRLAENAFAKAGLVDYSGPVLRLASLSPEDFFELLRKLRHVYASGDSSRYLLPDAAIQAFMAHSAKRLGEACFRTPRTTVTAFINLLAVLEQNPVADWKELIEATEITADSDGAADLMIENDDEFASFRL